MTHSNKGPSKHTSDVGAPKSMYCNASGLLWNRMYIFPGCLPLKSTAPRFFSILTPL